MNAMDSMVAPMIEGTMVVKCEAMSDDGSTSLSMSEVETIRSSMSECAICLGTDDECSITASLPCGHEFCKPCLHRHVVAELLKRRNAWCPTCRQPIEDEEVEQLCPEALGEVHDRAGSGDAEIAASPPATWIERKMQAYHFRRAAQRAHLKYCPQCRFAIEKNDGCNHMTCRCGHEFDWAAAETVVTCHRVHRGSKFFVWGSTCPGCSALAKVKLAALRTTVVIGAVPTVVIGAAVSVLAAPVMGIVLARKKMKKLRRLRQAVRDAHAESDRDDWGDEAIEDSIVIHRRRSLLSSASEDSIVTIWSPASEDSAL